MTPETIQSRIKTALPIEWSREVNVPLWALCKALSQDIKVDRGNAVKDALLDVETKAKEEASKVKRKRMTDEERADAVGDFLDERLLSGDISAAEIAQLKDIQNLKQKDRDIIIKVVSYKELLD